jgi:hypothetical protein
MRGVHTSVCPAVVVDESELVAVYGGCVDLFWSGCDVVLVWKATLNRGLCSPVPCSGMRLSS